MTRFTRRRFMAAAAAPLALGACANGVGGNGADRIEARVDAANAFMFQNVPGTQDLTGKSAGVLMMPLVTEAGFGLGGAYGSGALRVNNATVDYYSLANASVGLQIGAQQYSHAVFFMTQSALDRFRSSSGWVAGADVEYAVATNANAFTTDTTAINAPVYTVIFGQAGLIAGATIEGQKYSRFIP